jgi:hypothetical protein
MLAMKVPQQRRVVRRQRSGRQAQGAAAAPAPTQAPGAGSSPANAPAAAKQTCKKPIDVNLPTQSIVNRPIAREIDVGTGDRDDRPRRDPRPTND